jgi:hypothetical protein
MNFIKRMWQEKPLALILYSAFFLRLLSAIFSKGFGMHDDHFLVIEASKSWADGYDYNNWLPNKDIPHQQASGHSFFYVGLHYLLFVFLKFIGLTSAQGQMYVVRLLHALLSLITIYCGYKITEKLSSQKQAKAVGLLLAFIWFMPFMSVRNLVEVVCIPFLMMATWVIIKNEGNKKLMPFIWAGILLGLAFSIRFQSIIFTGGFGLALMFTKRFKEAIVVGIFFLFVAAGFQGICDYFIWGRPFVEFQEYVRYNIASAQDYLVQQWYMYLLLIGGIFIPPISLFFGFGFLRSWRKHLLLFLPSFLFLVFHSYFPNKQERFILPVIPFIMLLGYIGWDDFVTNSKFWQTRQKTLKYCWVFFWSLNILALAVVSFAYTKKNRVEAMTYLSHKGDVTNIVMEDSNRDEILMPPLFYLQKWVYVFGITNTYPAAEFYKEYESNKASYRPNYIIFMQAGNIDKRVAEVKKYFPTLTYETTIEPSYIDKLMHFLNPINENQTSYIYKIK